MSLFQKIKSTVVDEDPNDIGCRVVVDEETEEVCGNKVWGRGCVDGHTVKYCRETGDHVPSGAVSCGGRISTLTFYIPEDDEFIEVK